MREKATIEVSVKGKMTSLPGLCVNGQQVILSGNWLKIAQIHDETWAERQCVENPDTFLTALKQSGLGADLFSFAQSFTETTPRFAYPFEWDNLAVARTLDFSAWWQALPQESRKNVRRSEKRGVGVKEIGFNDELLCGIKNVYDETPVRQGRRFWHYGKDLDTIRKENSSYLDRSQFIAAFYKSEIIGFLKMVYVDSSARIMQILAKNIHSDKRPMNALLAKAVEICSQRGVPQLIYGQYIYGNKMHSPMTEFKRRNGFQQVLFPRYYIPVTWKGRLAVGAKVHRGLEHTLPEPILDALLGIRMKVYERVLARSNARDASIASE
jgi:hypothetical protein